MIVFRSSLVPIVALSTWFLAANSADGQATDGADFVPSTAVMSSRLNVQSFLKTPGFDWLPVEIAQAWSQDKLGLDPLAILHYKAVMSLPTGGGPGGQMPLGMIVTISQDYDPARISAELLDDPNPKMINGRQAYVIKDSRPETFVHAITPRKIYIGTEAMFGSMLAAETGQGAVAELIRANPIGQQHSQTVVAIEPLRPIWDSIRAEVASEIPPDLEGLTRLPDLVDAIVIESGVNGSKQAFQLELICEDADAAAEAQEILERGIEFGRVMAVTEIAGSIREQGRVAAAQRAYVARIAEYVTGLIQPEQVNDRLIVQFESEFSVASAGVLVGLLLPAVQAAREAARRTAAMNNLRQVALAFHNYHDAYGHLPPPAILDQAGNPLLSWRVAILPFMGEQALYERFHLDEPWDSEHNLQLANEVVAAYQNPGLPMPPDQTVFRAIIGEEIGIKPNGETQFRDIRDGTSNTMLLVEADASEATIWTKPGAMDIDPDNALAKMGHTRPGGFIATFFDGSVRFISHLVDQDLFWALLTRDGGEQIGPF